MLDKLPDTDFVAILPLVALILAGLAQYRYEPESAFLAHQRWRHRDVVIGWVILTAIHFVPSSVVSSITGMPLWAMDGMSALLVATSVWVLVRLRHRQPSRALGFDRRGALHEMLWSLRLGLGVVSILALLLLLLRIAAFEGRETPGRAVWLGQVDTFIATIVVATVLVPVAEELLCRGLTYGPLFRKFGALGATVGSATAWAVGHYDGLSASSLTKMLIVFILGVIYAEVYRRRQSLVPTVMFHIVQNITAVFIRDRYLATLIPFTGASVTLWVLSTVLFRLVSRTRTRAVRAD